MIKKNPKFFSELRKKSIAGLSRAAIMLQSEIKKTLSGSSPSSPGKPPGTLTGHLRRSIQIQKSGEMERKVGSSLPYAAAHEFGSVISVKSSDYLRFKLTDGSWRTAKSIILKPRPFLRPTLAKSKQKILKAFCSVK